MTKEIGTTNAMTPTPTPTIDPPQKERLYTLGAIKLAFRAEFHGSGAKYFSHCDSSYHNSTYSHWVGLAEELLSKEPCNVQSASKDDLNVVKLVTVTSVISDSNSRIGLRFYCPSETCNLGLAYGRAPKHQCKCGQKLKWPTAEMNLKTLRSVVTDSEAD